MPLRAVKHCFTLTVIAFSFRHYHRYVCTMNALWEVKGFEGESFLIYKIKNLLNFISFKRIHVHHRNKLYNSQELITPKQQCHCPTPYSRFPLLVLTIQLFLWGYTFKHRNDHLILLFLGFLSQIWIYVLNYYQGGWRFRVQIHLLISHALSSQ